MHRALLTVSVGRALRGPGGRSPPGIGGRGSELLWAGNDGQSARLGLDHLGDGAGVDIISAGQFHQVLQVVDEILNQEVIPGGPGLVNAMTDIIDSGVELICEFTHCGSVLPRAASGGDEPGHLPAGRAVGAVHHKHSCRAFRELYVWPTYADKLVMRITATGLHSILPTASIQCTMLGTHHARGYYSPPQHRLDRER